MKTMTLDEIEKYEISEDRMSEIKKFVNTDFSDCPKQTHEQLASFKHLFESHPELYEIKPKKTALYIKLDTDLVNELKSNGKGYQTRINAILRKAVFG